MDSNRVYCAECANCVQRKVPRADGSYVMQCACRAGNWWRNARETLASQKTLMRYIRRNGCVDYITTSDNDVDRERYIESLRELSQKPVLVYDRNGNALGITADGKEVI